MYSCLSSRFMFSWLAFSCHRAKGTRSQSISPYSREPSFDLLSSLNWVTAGFHCTFQLFSLASGKYSVSFDAESSLGQQNPFQKEINLCCRQSRQMVGEHFSICISCNKGTHYIYWQLSPHHSCCGYAVQTAETSNVPLFLVRHRQPGHSAPPASKAHHWQWDIITANLSAHSCPVL